MQLTKDEHKERMKLRREKQNSWEPEVARYVTQEYIDWINKQPKYKRIKKD